MWTVQEAKAKLSQVLQQARSGEAQIIGAQDPCVVISLDEYKRLTSDMKEPHPGKWLVENLAGLGEIELPPREDNRPIPFADWSDEDWDKMDRAT
jgi:prevent-host-death family protein